MSAIRSVCVYCGSRFGRGEEYRILAAALGREMAAAGIRVIYGGGHVGLMGVVADATMAAGGEVIGIIPEYLHDREVGHENLSELHIVPDMHVRKKMMFDKSDAFIVLPGGIGTLDETVEVTTWAQLDQHAKPIIFLNHNNYWQPYLTLIDHIIAHGFADDRTKELFQTVSDLPQLMAMLARLQPAQTLVDATID